jgi:hypothetical protein
LSLCLINHHALKTYGGLEVQLHAVDEGEWLLSRPGRFTPKERAPGTQWIGGWVDLRSGLEAMEGDESLALPRIEL